MPTLGVDMSNARGWRLLCARWSFPAVATARVRRWGPFTAKSRWMESPWRAQGVVFQPEGRGRDSTGFTDGDGNYTLNYIRDAQGAAVGWHSVRITAGDPVTGKPEPVPARYNVKSELRKEVKAGDNKIDFDLSST